jgi:RNA polymerase sigma-70 factor (ECF subfamily)
MSDPIEKSKARGRSPNFAISTVERFTQELRRYLIRRLGRPQEVDDLAQEVYLRLLRIDSAKCVHKPLAFVYGVAARVLADHRTETSQDDAYFVSAEELPESWSDHASDALSDRLEDSFSISQQIEKALAQLPAMHAAVLILHKRDGMSYEEVAVELQLSVHTVHKYLTEGRAQLRMKFSDR